MTRTNLLFSTTRALEAIYASNLNPDIKAGLSKTIREYNDIIDAAIDFKLRLASSQRKDREEYEKALADSQDHPIMQHFLKYSLMLTECHLKEISSVLKQPYEVDPIVKKDFDEIKSEINK